MRPSITMAVVGGLLAVQGCAVTALAPEAPPPTPTVGQPVVLDARVPGWQTAAWLAEDSFCVRVARVDEKRREGKENEFVFCDPAPEALDTVGPPLLPTKPMPYVAPLDPQQRKIILVGSVRGAVTSVSVTMFGQTATAAVHRLPATRSRQIGAYAAWLPRSEHERDGMNLSDITAVVGRDADGRVVTQLD
ncbi:MULTISPECIES: hypothetical protein [unclassified Solwaraspora]|uniref:hypothetical protein n=1 Tax=unclassified Solwaraspora TaxID=2627926 RepID=UPI00248B30F0|nr:MULTISPECIES: hypothetical protein [unclassified Solwaraspora]WBB97164.1 hypothetical protein O7553_28550 [Solwaraspora sp. WMMA2059]WBC18934.1 hypothetical protein O7543_18820 [Solwaraspora sp. WMMA2080]WJK33637.1 hypothetical protein O7610_23590 [Solwaraspora sp. WMMA2065]